MGIVKTFIGVGIVDADVEFAAARVDSVGEGAGSRCDSSIARRRLGAPRMLSICS